MNEVWIEGPDGTLSPEQARKLNGGLRRAQEHAAGINREN